MPARMPALPATGQYQAPPGHQCTPDGECAAGCGEWPCTQALAAANAIPGRRARPRPQARRAAPTRWRILCGWLRTRDWGTVALGATALLLGAALLAVLVLMAHRPPGGVLHTGAPPATTPDAR